MTASNPRLQLVLAKVDTAERRLTEFLKESTTFVAEHPITFGFRRDPETNAGVHFIATIPELPPALRVLAGELIQALRGALDHLVYQLYLAAGNNPDPTQVRHLQFPIAATEAKYTEVAPKALRGLTPEATAAIAALRPYKEGNPMLWLLNSTATVEKHREIFKSGFTFVGVDLLSMMAPDIPYSPADAQSRPILRDRDAKFPAAVGDELLHIGPNVEQGAPYFLFEVNVSESQPIEGPVKGSLAGAVADVRKIVESFSDQLK